jgi:cystinosin
MSVLHLASSVCGWIYFSCWSTTYYPQIYLNYKNRDVSGLSFDFVALTCLGATAYVIYNALFLFPVVELVFMNYYDMNSAPVHINDLLYAMHSQFVCLLLAYQCVTYGGGKKGISTLGLFAVCLGYVMIGYSMMMAGIKWINYSWIDALNLVGQIKLFCVAVKSIPQVYLNYSRQSVYGHSLWMISLNLIGGVFAMIQVFLNAYEYDTEIPFFMDGFINPKIGLALLSFGFDGIFIYQQYKYQHHEDLKVDAE